MNKHASTQRPILLVEDNPMDIDLAIRAFKKQKFINPIEVARDGEEALAWIEHCEKGAQFPLIVLLDLKLPKIHGLEVLQRFKEHHQFKKIPVIVLTSSGEDKDIETAYECGANSYIVKPVDFEKFIKVAAEIEIYWLATNELPR